MLALKLGVNEAVIITMPDGRDIRVTAVQIGGRCGGRQVKLGFEAPREVNVVREELLKRKRAG